jgi:protoheme ferro-lyase
MEKPVDLSKIGFITLSLLSGYLFLNFLVSSPLQSPFYSAGFSLVLMGVVVLGYRSFQNWLRLVAIPLFLLGFITGYLIGTAIFLQPITREELPPLEIPASKRSDGFTAVIYFTHGEPPTYEKAIPAWKHSIQEMDESGASFIPYPFRPFFFNAVRTEFLEAGGSQHNAIHNRMMMKLEQMMRSNYPKLRFYISFIDDRPHPNEAAWQAVKDGANKIVLTHVFLTESSHTLEGEEMIEELNLQANGIEVCTTYPLWNSDTLVEMFVDQAEQMRHNIPAEEVGILLVAHGQPSQSDKIYPKQTQQETDFRLAIRDRLVQSGYLADNISLAWMEYKEPTPQEGLRKLLQQNVRLVLVYSSSISAEGIHSAYEIPEMLNEVSLPEGVRLVNLGAWNDHPLVLQAIAERIESCLDEHNQ